MIYGAIDIGTNAARFLIGEVKQKNGNTKVKKISYSRVPLRLGLEVFDTGTISDKKVEQFLKTMKAFKLISEVFDVRNLRCCATSAMREATNGQEVRKHIEQEAGLDIEIIEGDEEAEIIFSTFTQLNFESKQSYIVIDVGGGSTEISLFNNDKKVKSKSFKIGTLRILKDKVDQAMWAELQKWVKDNVPSSDVKIYATGGNINKIHKLLGLRYMQPISTTNIQEIYDELLPLSNDEKMDLYQLKPDRADVIVPATKIYLTILKSIQAKEVIAPKIGLSDGMILTMFLKEQ